MSDLLQDLRYGLRMMSRSPVVSGVAALSLALGIAANAASFSIVDAFLLEPLPFPEQDRLMLIWEENLERDRTQVSPSAANFLDWRRETTVFEALAGYTMESANLTEPGAEPEEIQVVPATPELFETLGVAPARGRTFLAEEATEGADRVVVLTHDFWDRRYARNPDLLGATVTLDGVPHAVVGIMPEEFEMIPANVDVFRPTDFSDLREERRHGQIIAVGRLRPGATAERAGEEVAQVQSRLREAHPDANRGWTTRVQPFRDWFPGPTDTRLVLIIAAVTLLGLLIACANVANLLLARAEARQKEVAVRTAMGAGRGRIVRQLLTESVLLAGVAGVAGSLIAVWVVRGLSTAMPPQLPDTFWPRLDGTVLIALAVVTALAGVLFGLAPALYATRSDLREALGEGSRGGTASRKRKRLRSAFVVGEFAVALALLTGAGLMTQAFDRLINEDPGFEAEGLITFRLTVPEERYPEDDDVSRFLDRVVEVLDSDPATTAVGTMSTLPRGNNGTSSTSFTVDGEEPPEPGQEPVAGFQVVSPGYFETLGVELVEGRLLAPSDRDDAAPVVVVNQAFAGRYLDGEGALGRRVTLDGTSHEVVGVVETILQERIYDPAEGPSPIIYRTYSQGPVRSVAVAVRSAGADPARLGPLVRERVWSVDPDQPIAAVQTLESFIETSLSGPRVIALFLAAIGVIALALAALGIYGVMAHSVAQQTREIGIRMAMGADRGSVVRLVLGGGATLAGVGLLVGLPLSWGMYEAVAGTLQGVVEVVNPLRSFGLVVATLAAVALVSTWLPAWRAARVEPVRALQDE